MGAPWSPPRTRKMLQGIEPEQNQKGYAEHHHAHRSRARVIEFLELDDDKKRRDFGFHRQIASDENHRAVFAHRAGKRERAAGQKCGGEGRQNDAPEGLKSRSSERGGWLFVLAAKLRKNRLQGA